MPLSLIKHLCHATLLAVALVAVAPIHAQIPIPADGISADPAAVWNSETLGKFAQAKQGQLVLAPASGPWNQTTTVSSMPFYFWNQNGLTLRFRLTVQPPAAGEEQGSAFTIGLTSAQNVGYIQSTDNFVGLAIRIGKDGAVTAGLARKEKNGARENARGDSKGNVAYYQGLPADIKAASPGQPLDVTLTMTPETISASIAGTAYSQKAPSGLTKEFWKTAYIVAQCMNLNGGRGSVVIDNMVIESATLSADHIRMLDLRPFANMEFKDAKDGDQKGGWTDQGNNDLRFLTTGRQIIRTLPFDIINPTKNNAKSAVMLYSLHKDFFPKLVGPIPVGDKAESLVFLHSAAWGRKEGVVAARYHVEYDDSSSVDIPITVGQQIADFWDLKDPSDPNAALLLKVKSERSLFGLVGIYGYRWINPQPEKTITSLTLISAQQDPIVGVLAVTLVRPEISASERDLLLAAFDRVKAVDYRKDPPDKNRVSDQVTVKVEKRLGDTAFSTNGSYSGGDAGMGMFTPAFGDFLKSFGGLARFPYGLEISFYFWPYESKDFRPVLAAKGGTYGTIERWYYRAGSKTDNTLSYQQTLAGYKKLGLKTVLLFNTHSMFDGHDFVYVKTLPEEKMKRQNPLDSGTFSTANLDAIVKNNATLVDYVIKNGYEDTVALWEMDNERWDMQGKEYAQLVAAHVNMLRERLPRAKVIVCLGDQGQYAANPDGTNAIVWSRDLLNELRRLGMNGKIDYFAPHLYPYLADTASEIMQNYVDDFGVRNVNRALDTAGALLDAYGFQQSQLYISEWGTQSDRLGNENRNDLLTSMSAAVATSKIMMAIYSHPRVEGGTWHQWIHRSYVSRSLDKPVSKWGNQTIYFTDTGKCFTTPPAQAVRMFTQFAHNSTLKPQQLDVPHGVHCIKAKDESGDKYFVVNSTANPVTFPVTGISKRESLYGDSLSANSILKYGSFAENASEVQEMVPRQFNDAVLPPYSINILR